MLGGCSPYDHAATILRPAAATGGRGGELGLIGIPAVTRRAGARDPARGG
jgi:hypothetical protein